jgi:hypothetical protein
MLADATGDHAAVVPVARHVDADDFDPAWQRALRRWRVAAWRTLGRLDHRLFGYAPPWMEGAAFLLTGVSAALLLLASFA